MPRKPTLCEAVSICLQALGVVGGDAYSQLAAEDLDEVRVSHPVHGCMHTHHTHPTTAL